MGTLIPARALTAYGRYRLVDGWWVGERKEFRIGSITCASEIETTRADFGKWRDFSSKLLSEVA